MQICPVNKTNFGMIENKVYMGSFNPNKDKNHKRIVQTTLENSAIKEFTDKYRCDVVFSEAEENGKKELSVGLCPVDIFENTSRLSRLWTKLCGLDHYKKVSLISKKDKKEQEMKLPNFPSLFALAAVGPSKSDYENNAPENCVIERCINEINEFNLSDAEEYICV